MFSTKRFGRGRRYKQLGKILDIEVVSSKTGSTSPQTRKTSSCRETVHTNLHDDEQVVGRARGVRLIGRV